MAEAFVYDHLRTPRGKGKKDGGRLIRACKRWCKIINEPYRAVSSPIRSAWPTWR